MVYEHRCTAPTCQVNFLSPNAFAPCPKCGSTNTYFRMVREARPAPTDPKKTSFPLPTEPIQEEAPPAPELSGHPRFYKLLDEIRDLHNRKNHDYRGNEGPISNFTRMSSIMKLYPEMDWDSPFGTAIVQLLKQLDAALALRSSKKESAVQEDISSRMRDISVFALLSIVLHEEGKLGQDTKTVNNSPASTVR